MLRSALHFSTDVQDILGEEVDWARLKSEPFTYAIMNDSLLFPEQLISHYEKVQAKYFQIMKDEQLDYLGDSPKVLYEKTGKGNRFLNPESFIGQMATAEVSIDTRRFRQLFSDKLSETTNVELHYQHRIHSIEESDAGYKLEGQTVDGSTWRLEADRVVNCLWDGRLKLDEQLGRLPSRPWVYRRKYRLMITLPEILSEIPTLTMVLGRYGDLVKWSGRSTYLSWYPTCLQGWCNEISIPQEWEKTSASQGGNHWEQSIAQQTLAQLDEHIPGIAKSRIDSVYSGVIFSWGKSDIDDPESELHGRHNIGVHAYDGYYSIDTGKLTTAPAFAKQLMQHF